MAFTFFFRDKQTIELAVEHILPVCTGKKLIHIWDAGCAMGPEPYTLTIILAEKMGHFSFKNLRIEATDIDTNENFGAIVSAGEYPEEMLKRIPEDLFKKYFQPSTKDGYFIIDYSIRRRVAYQWHDLLSCKSISNDFILVVCKNVLLHLSPKQRIDVIRMFHQSLEPGGYLLMENTQKLPVEVEELFQQKVPYSQLFQKIG